MTPDPMNRRGKWGILLPFRSTRIDDTLEKDFPTQSYS
jgi:hypothetical protein